MDKLPATDDEFYKSAAMLNYMRNDTICKSFLDMNPNAPMSSIESIYRGYASIRNQLFMLTLGKVVVKHMLVNGVNLLDKFMPVSSILKPQNISEAPTNEEILALLDRQHCNMSSKRNVYMIIGQNMLTEMLNVNLSQLSETLNVVFGGNSISSSEDEPKTNNNDDDEKAQAPINALEAELLKSMNEFTQRSKQHMPLPPIPDNFTEPIDIVDVENIPAINDNESSMPDNNDDEKINEDDVKEMETQPDDTPKEQQPPPEIILFASNSMSDSVELVPDDTFSYDVVADGDVAAVGNVVENLPEWSPPNDDATTSFSSLSSLLTSTNEAAAPAAAAPAQETKKRKHTKKRKIANELAEIEELNNDDNFLESLQNMQNSSKKQKTDFKSSTAWDKGISLDVSDEIKHKSLLESLRDSDILQQGPVAKKIENEINFAI